MKVFIGAIVALFSSIALAIITVPADLTTVPTLTPDSSTRNTIVSQGASVTQMTVKPMPLTEQPVVWSNSTANVTVTGSSVTKVSGGTAFNASAWSTSQTIISGKNGYVTFPAPTGAAVESEIGLSSATGTAAAFMSFGIYFVNTTTYQFIDGGSAFTGGTYTSSDTFKIAINGNIVTYYINGTLVRTSVNAPSYPQYPIMQLSSQGVTASMSVINDTSASQSVDMVAIQNATGSNFFSIDKYGQTKVQGGLVGNRIATAASYTVLTNDFFIGVTSTAAARTITLPTATAAGAGKVYIIKDESGAAATNNITVARSSTDTIDGAISAVISTNYGVVRLYTDGSSKWFTF